MLQSLDSLGAGFTLASHDLDLRGAGNLLGDEQSGHIKEVGYELYQQMIEEAVAKLRTGEDTLETDGSWSPQINIGTSVLIPESYVEDLQVRLGLYRRLADLHDQQAVDGFGAELHDRFGRVPEEVHHLLDDRLDQAPVPRGQCRRAWMPAPRVPSSSFRGDAFANPGSAGANGSPGRGRGAKLRPDMKLVIMRDWDKPEERLKGTRQLMQKLVKLAA